MALVGYARSKEFPAIFLWSFPLLSFLSSPGCIVGCAKFSSVHFISQGEVFFHVLMSRDGMVSFGDGDFITLAGPFVFFS